MADPLTPYQRGNRDARTDPQPGDEVRWLGQPESRRVVAVDGCYVTFDVYRRGSVIGRRTVSLRRWAVCAPDMQVVSTADALPDDPGAGDAP